MLPGMGRSLLTAKQRAELNRLVRCGKTESRIYRRARIVLLAAHGLSKSAIAGRLGTNRYRVNLWLGRFEERGVPGLKDLSRSGRPREISALERHEVLAAACRDPRDLGLERDLWSHHALAEVLAEGALVEAISASSVGRILRAGDLKPHRVKMWCHSKDPQFREKLHDIVQLYLNLPPGEPVVCVDEKSGMQALSRQRGVVRGGQQKPNRLEFEYRRNGTRCLFGCFNVRTGQVLGWCSPTRKREDFFAFMDRVASRYRQERVHVVLDNLNTHHDTSAGDFVSQWNRRHGNRFVFHYTPTHASWLNQIELWFGILTRRVLKHGSFETVEALEKAVLTFVDQWNSWEAHPFRWTYEGIPLAA